MYTTCVRLLPLLLVLATTMWADGLGPWSAIHGRRPRPLAYPLAESVSPDGAIIRRLQEPGGPLLELPIGRGGREEPRPQARAMYRSIFHWRPLLNGYSSYWPSAHPGRMELAQRLPDPKALRTLRAETGLQAVLVHGGDLTDAERTAWSAAGADAGPLRLVVRDGDDLLFEVGDPEGAASAPVR